MLVTHLAFTFFFFFFLMIRPPPKSTLFPTPPLSRSRRLREPRRPARRSLPHRALPGRGALGLPAPGAQRNHRFHAADPRHLDRKSTRLNSSHLVISYAVFCLKKKKNTY